METEFAQSLTFCAGSIVFFYGGIEVNRRRDLIILGVLDGVPMDRGHRFLILVNDWMPLKFGLAAVAAAAALAIYEMASKSGSAYLRPHEVTMIAVGGFGCVFNILYGFRDFFYCLKELRKSQ